LAANEHFFSGQAGDRATRRHCVDRLQLLGDRARDGNAAFTGISATMVAELSIEPGGWLTVASRWWQRARAELGLS